MAALRNQKMMRMDEILFVFLFLLRIPFLLTGTVLSYNLHLLSAFIPSYWSRHKKPACRIEQKTRPRQGLTKLL